MNRRELLQKLAAFGTAAVGAEAAVKAVEKDAAFYVMELHETCLFPGEADLARIRAQFNALFDGSTKPAPLVILPPGCKITRMEPDRRIPDGPKTGYSDWPLPPE